MPGLPYLGLGCFHLSVPGRSLETVLPGPLWMTTNLGMEIEKGKGGCPRVRVKGVGVGQLHPRMAGAGLSAGEGHLQSCSDHPGGDSQVGSLQVRAGYRCRMRDLNQVA